MTFILIIIV